MERLIGIDYIRAFFSVCVVLVHLGYISPSLIFNKELYPDHKFTTSDFVNFYILLLAVPVFFIASNYLFFIKTRTNYSLLRYLRRIGKIAAFWIILYQIFMHKGWDIVSWIPESPYESLVFVMSGGYTKYYFFISLIGLTIIVHLTKALSVSKILIFFLLTTLLVAMTPILSIKTGIFSLSMHWSFLNFIPYPFAAILVFHIAKKEKHLLYAVLLAICGAFLALLDWFFYVNKGFFNINHYGIPAYTRPSLIFISMAVLLLSVKIEPKRKPLIDFMSKNSLALYCLHPFFIDPAIKLSNGNLLISLFLVLIFSYFTASVMKLFIQHELIN
jgi:surface polysaccharide O-acyltransferase-like enzyme